MQKNLKQLFLLLCITLVLVLPYFVFAGNTALDGLTGVQADSGFSPADEYTLAKTIGTLISGIMSLLGVIFIALMLYAGFNWMTAAGDSGKLDTAKNTIRRAIIGLVIVAGSYAIWYFVLTVLD